MGAQNSKTETVSNFETAQNQPTENYSFNNNNNNNHMKTLTESEALPLTPIRYNNLLASLDPRSPKNASDNYIFNNGDTSNSGCGGIQRTPIVLNAHEFLSRKTFTHGQFESRDEKLTARRSTLATSVLSGQIIDNKENVSPAAAAVADVADVADVAVTIGFTDPRSPCGERTPVKAWPLNQERLEKAAIQRRSIATSNHAGPSTPTANSLRHQMLLRQVHRHSVATNGSSGLDFGLLHGSSSGSRIRSQSDSWMVEKDEANSSMIALVDEEEHSTNISDTDSVASPCPSIINSMLTSNSISGLNTSVIADNHDETHEVEKEEEEEEEEEYFDSQQQQQQQQQQQPNFTDSEAEIQDHSSDSMMEDVFKDISFVQNNSNTYNQFDTSTLSFSPLAPSRVLKQPQHSNLISSATTPNNILRSSKLSNATISMSTTAMKKTVSKPTTATITMTPNRGSNVISAIPSNSENVISSEVF